MTPAERIAELEAALTLAQGIAADALAEKGEATGKLHELQIHLAGVEAQMDELRSVGADLARLKNGRAMKLALGIERLGKPLLRLVRR